MLNIPNILSIFRLCLTPVFVLIYFSGTAYARYCAVLVYAVATFTDYLDGYIARKYNLITNLGKVLDPLGDKMFTFTVLACIAMDGIIPHWMAALFFIKEALMGIGSLYIHRRIKVEIPPSNMLGKAASVLFFVICVMLILADGIIPPVGGMIAMGVAFLVSFAAFASYLINMVRLIKNT